MHLLLFWARRLPGGVKIGTAIAITAIMLPYLISHAKTPIVTYDALFACYCLKELFIGTVIAFLVGIPFYIAQSSGVLIDFLRGSSALQVQDPIMQSQSSSIGQLYNYVFIVLFYDIGGPFIFFEGVLNSYSIIPADSFIPVAFFSLQMPFWQFMMGMLTKFLALSLQLAAPSLVAILMAEMFLGIANRLAPQVQIAFLGMALKSFVGLGSSLGGLVFHFAANRQTIDYLAANAQPADLLNSQIISRISIDAKCVFFVD